MTSFYSANELEADWYAFDLADTVSRTAAAEAEAGHLFERATRRQKDEFDAALATWIGCKGDAWTRKREDLRAKFHNDTAAARVLFEKSVAEILDAGEISEATNEAWDKLMPQAQKLMQAAE